MRKRWIILGSIYCLSFTLYGQEVLFRTDSILHFTLTADFSSLFSNRYDEKYSVEGGVSIANTRIENAPVKIGVRGNYRRDQENCSFPPIYLKNKSSSEEVDRINKIKLVTHCQDDPYFQQYILREYLAYRIYNQLTDLSFKVRLCKITYMDGDQELLTRFGFLIEENKKLARRINSKKVKNLVPGENIPDFKNTGLVSLFQVMIGNTDWYIPDHNIRVYADKVSKDTLIVPYDFDLSGLVNKPGAEPRVGLPIKSVTERHYLGHCRGQEELEDLVRLFNQKKDAIYKEVAGISDMNPETMKEINTYMDQFYEIINNPKELSQLMESCSSYF